MFQPLKVQNTLTRLKEPFVPIKSPFVGLYVCGPTVYNEPHLGNCRTFISFDIIYRYLKYIGYQVRYVRNITDAGHLTNDAGEGNNRIEERAKLEQLEPMEIVQKYSVSFRNICNTFNMLAPSIEPTATGHILEQIEMTEKLINKGFAYEVNGSVYFDVRKFNEAYGYGKLSGRNIDELQAGYRDLDGQEEKRSSLDFALWKRVSPAHIQRWKSPWGEGTPGWHIECSAMSTKYLGQKFDIHGGGMDLKFPHHECEIAQSVGCTGEASVNYWLHTNMLTVNGQKMSKSLGNSFLPHELFSGSHPLLEKGYSPMVVRFFMLQTHYASTLDFSNEALQASEKGFKRLLEAIEKLDLLKTAETSSSNILAIQQNCFDAMNDDFNTPILLAELFNSVRVINSIYDGKETINASDLALLKTIMHEFVFDVLGLQPEINNEESSETIAGLMQLIIDIRKTVRENKDFSTSDKIRNQLNNLNIQLKDGKEGTTWIKE